MSRYDEPVTMRSPEGVRYRTDSPYEVHQLQARGYRREEDADQQQAPANTAAPAQSPEPLVNGTSDDETDETDDEFDDETDEFDDK